MGVRLDEILAQQKEVFQEGLGTLQGYSAKIQVDPSASPKYYEHCEIPYTYKLKVEEELGQLIKQESKL